MSKQYTKQLSMTSGFCKMGRYQVPNGICYLLILKSVEDDIHEKSSNFNKKVPPIHVNTEVHVLVHLKNIERPCDLGYGMDVLHMYWILKTL